ncbi:hypothetical protein Lepto7375DRAFT_7415 [Leptolyngbya sp. PCC 7375]|nr:hypothetical protein Lepto7375DRAFT_7415 [Leptolyngbya sp. PCC 7375]
MIVATTTIPIPPGTYERVKQIAIPPHQPFTQGFTHTYELQGYPNFRLLEGIAVPSHNDGIAGYRPILMLHNPGSNYIVRGRDETGLLYQLHGPQNPGDLIILDVEAKHEVRSKDPNGGHGAWAGLVWGIGGQPLPKAEWEPEKMLGVAKEEFEKFLEDV